ncbi:dihydrodipicolinate synthase family protein [Bifidobacterium sp. ESL0745]|uniref:dihydrodipicolinate synthase family protein n=1 Tax=Bifidobacterium sp. ESL0745 TaxID=2983226 RepID=UPI0023F7417C|nr:dihydrodipicolinate synthase family protein [Bifidobacterium sp. ESL0745]MDF7666194.1 dihydrodipicolinate synthase family protein [Bifidobacterium sp. ESL0745]
MNMNKNLDGVICPSITITKENGDIDYEAWGRHLDHLVTAGIDGILIFGSIGEFYAFPLDVKEKVTDFAVKRVAGRTNVFIGVGGTNPDEVVELTRYASKAGADAVVAVAPYYFGPSDASAKDYYAMICEATSIPVILYNFPPRTGMDLSPALVAELVKAHPEIVGIKDTVDTISHTRKMIAAVRPVNPDFRVFSGFDEYYTPNRIAGGNGVICGLTNAKPELFHKMNEAYLSGDYATSLECAKKINKLMAIYDTADLFVSAIKGAVKAEEGPISTDIRRPAVQLTEQQFEQIKQLLNV